MINKMTSLQAFKAMICFLDDYYSKTASDDMGSLLGDIQLFEDGSGTWDSAAWNDWCVALEEKKMVTLVEGFKGVFNFLMAYYIRISCSSSDIKILLDAMTFADDKELLSSSIWRTWKACSEKKSYS